MPDQKLSALTAAGILTGEEQLYVVQNGNSRKVALSEVLEVSSAISENRIINGAFDFWQRGTTQGLNGFRSADRWALGFTGGTVSLSRGSETLGVTLGNNNLNRYAKISVSGQTLSSHAAYIHQPIESVRSYAGQTITVLGWARRSAGAGDMAIAPYQVFGTGGSPSADVIGIGQRVVLSTSWAPFAVTFTIPSIAGKTIGTNANDYLLLRIFASAGAGIDSGGASLGLQTIDIDLWGIHIRHGTHTVAACDAYIAPDRATEFNKCLRYYETGNVFFTAYQAASSGFGYARPISPKRAPPSVTFSGTTYINASGLSAISVNTGAVVVTAVASSTGAVNFSATAAFDAEL